MDATPGRITTFTTIINREGTFYGQCSELCGANHGFMPIEVKAINPYAFMEYYLTNAENVY
ncbi:MAG: hypothetical protein JKY54_04640 [Flavobacteriales bacterium]|nr:hypothetical protein [Flavobacteriales bacterium]